MKINGAVVMQCDICEAPCRRPLPPGWSATHYTVGLRNFVQIHRPQCPAGFQQKVFLPDDEEEVEP